MRTSEKTNEFYTAKAKAQLALTNVETDAFGNFKNAYASLAATMDAVRPVLAANGIALSQFTRLDGDVMMLVTRLSHTSGQFEEGDFPVCKFPARSHDMGSGMTYSRRYSLLAAVGIAPTDEPGEDDGSLANNTPIPAPKPEKPPELSAEQSSEILEELIASLKKCVSFTALEEWGEANRGKTANLIKAHRVRIGEEYKKLENSIKQVRKANG